ETFPYINEPTNSNLEIETPEKYFLEKGTDVRAEIKSREVVPPFAKGILGDIIAEVFKLYQISETSKMLDRIDRKSTRLNSSHVSISYAVFCLKKKKPI